MLLQPGRQLSPVLQPNIFPWQAQVLSSTKSPRRQAGQRKSGASSRVPKPVKVSERLDLGTDRSRAETCFASLAEAIGTGSTRRSTLVHEGCPRRDTLGRGRRPRVRSVLAGCWQLQSCAST